MTKQHFAYEPYLWDVSVYYDVDCRDTDRILSELKGIGCYGDNLFRARQNIESCTPNNGVTFANLSTKEMVVVITKTTSSQEFFNTLIHELHHMAEFVAKADNLPMVGEEISYIAGGLGMLMWPKARHYMCDKCRTKNKDNNEKIYRFRSFRRGE